MVSLDIFFSKMGSRLFFNELNLNLFLSITWLRKKQDNNNYFWNLKKKKTLYLLRKDEDLFIAFSVMKTNKQKPVAAEGNKLALLPSDAYVPDGWHLHSPL